MPQCGILQTAYVFLNTVVWVLNEGLMLFIPQSPLISHLHPGVTWNIESKWHYSIISIHGGHEWSDMIMYFTDERIQRHIQIDSCSWFRRINIAKWP